MVDLSDSRPVQRTKAALFDAFVGLVLERRYDQLKVADIIARAGVSRSTFYEHYEGKDDLLKAGLSAPFGILADMVCERHDPERLQGVVEHFWENRRMGNILFAGPTRGLLARTLAGLIEERLQARHDGPPAVLLAAQLAGGQIGLLTAWLSGQAPATPEAIVEMLYAAAPAMAEPR